MKPKRKPCRSCRRPRAYSGDAKVCLGCGTVWRIGAAERLRRLNAEMHKASDRLRKAENEMKAARASWEVVWAKVSRQMLRAKRK